MWWARACSGWPAAWWVSPTGGLHQVRPGQEIQQVLGLLEAGVGQGCGGVGIKVGVGVQPEQPERPPSVGRQV